MPSRRLAFPVFDADNHLYEPKEALTQFLPENGEGVIDYTEVRGRTKIMVHNVVSDYISNPTFEVVAKPGAQEDDFEQVADLCGIDRIIFGSDWPHPEVLADPIDLVSDEKAHGLGAEGVQKGLGGNMIDLFKVPNQMVHEPDVPALVLA
jgi:hypothetical protein